jgi:putative hydrolase of the HAD superfamily
VGDGGSNELQGAKKLGITTIMITAFIRDMSREKIDERKKFADYVIENIDELLP